MKPVYLDYNATTPIDRRVVKAMLPYINEHFGNPSSSHGYGITAKKAVDTARAQIAELLHCRSDEIIFTSGGSESNNYAIKGVAAAFEDKGNHIITSAIEHPAVTEVCGFLETKGFQVTYLPVDGDGLVDPDDVKKAITPETILISIMHANNEVGTIQPIAEIARIARDNDVLMHSDCAQSIAKISVRVDELGVDLLTVAGHKLYAPKGIGALYIRSGIELEKQIHGADHEMNLRSGTENVIEIVGLGRACALAANNLQQSQNHLQELRDFLEDELTQEFPDCRVNGHRLKRLPNTSSISFRGLEANTIISELADTVAASAGAACHSDRVDVSTVLQAMEVPLEYAMGTIRFSVGRFSTIDEIKRALVEIKKVVRKLKPQSVPDEALDDPAKVRLTRYTHGLGCACKLRPQLLEKVLSGMPVSTDKNILVGINTSDDAAVYRVSDELAVVQTVDFFTPIVDDPFMFGVIAAVNSLSDIYAMGAKPLFALNIVGFPSNRLGIEVLQKILDGARSVADAAGISIIGGHTVDDSEPKFGLAVTGSVHPEQIARNRGAQPGDVLILTKSLGSGIFSTALKQGLLSEDKVDQLSRVMATLNRDAAEIMQEVGVNACTDVTGFGLIGHLLEMMRASGTTAQLAFSDIPFFDGVLELAASGIIPGGTTNNFEFTGPQVSYEKHISRTQCLMLNDAQTSGGLLISLTQDKTDQYLSRYNQKTGLKAAIIGRVVAGQDKSIEVV